MRQVRLALLRLSAKPGPGERRRDRVTYPRRRATLPGRRAAPASVPRGHPASVFSFWHQGRRGRRIDTEVRDVPGEDRSVKGDETVTEERPDCGGAGSVTRRIPGLRRGDRRAVQALWERYFAPLARIAEARLRGAPRRAGDGEDAAVEALLSFCRDVQKEGRFSDLSGRDSLMRLLVRFTVCRALDFRTREERRRRTVRGDSALGEPGFEPHPGREPPPELQAQVADLLARLPDEELRSVARLRMEGHTNAEIASLLGRGLSTVELKLARIRGYLKADWIELIGERREDKT